jgi:hypothetical protein
LPVGLRREDCLVDNCCVGIEIRERVGDRREGKLRCLFVAHDGSQASLTVTKPFAPAVQFERGCGLLDGSSRECRRLHLGGVGEQLTQRMTDCVRTGHIWADVVLDASIAGKQADLELER